MKQGIYPDQTQQNARPHLDQNFFDMYSDGITERFFLLKKYLLRTLKNAN